MFKSFRVNVIVRLSIITLLVGLMLYFVISDAHYLRSIYLFIFLIIALVELFWYIDRTNRAFSSFLMALMQNDFTTTFSATNKGRSFGELYRAFNMITDRFKKLSSDKQAQHIYLETLVEHVKVGIISFDENEKIQLMNEAFKKLSGKPTILYLKSLNTVNEDLVETLRSIEPGDQKLLKISIGNNLMQLAIHASTFKIHDGTYKLISVQNIKNELDSNELDAWQKLIRVLTHEIMNSVTPISSLTDTLTTLTSSELKKETPEKETMQKVVQGLQAIKSRSTGLQSFTEAYRKLTRIPPPTFGEVDLIAVLERIQTLLAESLKDIDFKVSAPKHTLNCIADAALLEQVFINLIKNAIEAVEGINEPKIRVSINRNDKVNVTISDNGPGIDKDKIDKIFIPFFTTKSEGSGIGLALSREIMRLHNGNIEVHSDKSGTSFTLTF